MPADIYYHALNVGVVDKDKLHRTDLEKMRLAAEDQTNLLCDAVGKAFLRPGFEHIEQTNGGKFARLMEFAAGGQQVYGLELTDNALKVLDGDNFVSRPSVATVITSGTFSSSTGWLLGTTPGTTAVIASGVLQLKAQAHNTYAYAQQVVAVSVGDQAKEHAVRVIVYRGPVKFRVGTTVNGQDLVKETVLRTGYHSLAFIPGGNFYVEFGSDLRHSVYVNSIQIEAAGDMVLPTVWDEDDLPFIRADQSLDVLFLACEGRKPQRIESRGDNSWSVCDFDSNDGPFLSENPNSAMRMQPTVLEGEGLLNSNQPFFTPDHVGALFRLYHNGQRIDTWLANNTSFTQTILVTGINEPNYNERAWSYDISGTWAGTLRVQRSFDGDDIEFHNFRNQTGVATVDITANVGPIDNDDNEDNAIAYYRIGFEAGTYTSGAAHIVMTYQGGGGFGICRVVNYISPTQVEIEVLKPFSNTSYTDNWREGAWSEANGWPTSCAFHEGRFWLAGYDAIWGSVSDAYESFDEDFIGDAGPILRSIALGGRNEARWLVPLSNLMVGTNSQIAAARASSLDEIMTPENMALRRLTKIGASRINPAILADDRALFVEAAGQSIYELTYAPDKGRFLAGEFSKLTTDLFLSGVRGIAVQNRPDQRIWIPTGDDDMVCIVFEPAQEVVAHIPISTGYDTDKIESVIILPGDNGQDRMVASIKRVVNGVTSRRIERLAMDREALPDYVTKCLDSHVVFGSGSTSVSLPHLIGRTVWAWVDGKYVEDGAGTPIEFTVSGGGTITLPVAPTVGGCAGLPYRGRYKSAKLEYGAGGSTSMLRNKVLAGVGLLMGDFCRSGVKFGGEFDNAAHPLFNLPGMINGIPIVNDITVGPGEPEMVNPTDSKITLDARMCIELTKPGTILALVMQFEGYG